MLYENLWQNLTLEKSNITMFKVVLSLQLSGAISKGKFASIPIKVFQLQGHQGLLMGLFTIKFVLKYEFKSLWKFYSGFVLMVVNMFKVFGLSFLHRLNSLVATSLIQLDVSKVSCVFWVERTSEKLLIWKLKSIILLVPKHKEDVFKKRKGEAWRNKLNLWMCLVDWK